MDSLSLVRPLASAIYGRVLLVRHRSSGRYYALKVMSLPHMRAHRAVTGPYVQEDGETELQILRTLGSNFVYSSNEESTEERNESDVSSWSVSPVWNNGVDDKTVMAASQLGSRHLLTLHHDFVDCTTNTRCLLFDYCPYGDLFAHVGSPNDVSLDVARSWFGQIASAVRFLHARNVAHRDLSLENVLLDSSRRCRLADFGLASATGSCCFGTRVGKVLYMAPEVFSRPPCRPDASAIPTTEGCYNGLQADIWSLGVILFILVTKIPPFEKASGADARFRLLSTPGGSVRDLFRVWGQESRLPCELRALLDWMLRVDPLQRPTADQVCDHEWLVDKNPTKVAEEMPTKAGEKRPSEAEPEEEEDGENLEPLKMSNRRDESWTCGSPRSNKRVKRME
ncbi:protein kinase [Phytophthora infestans T30-4]|uniref:Protein kinase n=1 Tax=Phytophthora infestans (strain T30-4) TaxID=403677 RepID=D0N2D6_PHYIT|nr:protein kinase [Phytophthora infestans T30-4]EEY68465.1 protein kinase [Phytophthora infestans T30-4]|eukprot:XP_002905624.1 protein kinase [Phytophthora infestans T30-4]